MNARRPALFWVLGRGGMLGSHIESALATHVPAARIWRPPIASLSWTHSPSLRQELESCAERFSAAVGEHDGRWGVIWAAGAGVIGTSPAALAAEVDTWQVVLSLIAERIVDRHGGGLVFLSSSAGGVFGQCPDPCITEASTCRPISAYGLTKKRQEEALEDWAARHPGVDWCVGRISNLYGAGQNVDKPQGLISHVSRCMLWQQPVRIYVPLDTIRDFIHVDDCANRIARFIDARLAGDGPSLPRLKIFAAEEPTSVAQIIGCFMHLGSHRHPRIICAPSPLAEQQPRRLLFRSIVPPDTRSAHTTPLQVGVAQVHLHQTRLFCQGRLAPPPVG